MLYSSTRQTHFTAFCSWSTFALSVVCFLLFFFFPSSALKQINIEQNCKLFDWRNALGFSANFCITLSLCLYGSGAWFWGLSLVWLPGRAFWEPTAVADLVHADAVAFHGIFGHCWEWAAGLGVLSPSWTYIKRFVSKLTGPPRWETTLAFKPGV